MGLRWGELLESDYIPEAYVFDRPPSLEGSATDVLGLHSKRWQKSGTDSRDYPHLYYLLAINPFSLPHTHPSFIFVRTSIFVRTFIPSPLP